MRIQSIDPATPDAVRLMALSDTYMGALYPAESNHFDPVEALQASNVHFLGVYIEEALVACGAVKILSDDGVYGEVKRVFVLEEHRGQGLSKKIMEHLERHLLDNGVTVARLETGAKQPEALGLYKKLGYVQRGPFGDYAEDPISVFMEKQLV